MQEREVKAKHQQLISGVCYFLELAGSLICFIKCFNQFSGSLTIVAMQVSIWSYWFSTYVWDFVSFLFPTCFAIILFYIFGTWLDFISWWRLYQARHNELGLLLFWLIPRSLEYLKLIYPTQGHEISVTEIILSVYRHKKIGEGHGVSLYPWTDHGNVQVDAVLMSWC